MTQSQAELFDAVLSVVAIDKLTLETPRDGWPGEEREVVAVFLLSHLISDT